MNAAGILALGSRFRKVLAAVPDLTYDSGNTKSVELPRSFLFQDIFVRLSGTFDVTANGTAHAEAPLTLIQNLQLVADGRKVLWQASGRDLHQMCRFFWGVAPERTQGAIAIGNNVAFSATFLIPNEAVRMALAADSLFDPREFDKIELRCQWAAITALGTGTFTADTNIKLSTHVKNTTAGVELAQFNRVVQFDETVVGATSSALKFPVPRSGLLAGFLLSVNRDGAPVDDVVNFVTLRSDGSFNHVDRIPWRDYQERNVIEHQLAARQSGWLYVDMTEDGLMSSALNVNAMNTLDILLDVTKTSGTETIRVIYLFFEPQQKAA